MATKKNFSIKQGDSLEFIISTNLDLTNYNSKLQVNDSNNLQQFELIESSGLTTTSSPSGSTIISSTSLLFELENISLISFLFLKTFFIFLSVKYFVVLHNNHLQSADRLA